MKKRLGLIKCKTLELSTVQTKQNSNVQRTIYNSCDNFNPKHYLQQVLRFEFLWWKW